MKRQRRNPKGECHGCGCKVPNDMRFCQRCWAERKRGEGRR